MIDFAGIGKVFLVGDIHGMFPPFHAFARRVRGRCDIRKPGTGHENGDLTAGGTE